MIDKNGYRINIGIVLTNSDNRLFWGRRRNQAHAWQFPQGGVRPRESLQQALYRELFEEIGLEPQHVTMLAMSKGWRVYHLPKKYRRYDSKPVCIGQRQRWFLLQLQAEDNMINLRSSSEPEFDDWKWVEFWHPVDEVVSFKRHVYQSVLEEFAEVLFNKTDMV